jgi:hypothetical protein
MPGLHGRRDFLHMGMKSVFGSWLGATTLMTSCRGGSSGAVGVEASPLTAARASCLGGRDADAVVVVSSMAALGTAVNAAPPGRNILVAPGTYTGGTLTFNRDGTAAHSPSTAMVLRRTQLSSARRTASAQSRSTTPTGHSRTRRPGW